MSDPCAELQPVVRAALKGSVDLQAIFGTGNPVPVYDIPPTNKAGAYLVIGQDSVLPDLAECIDGAEVSATVHVYSLMDPPGLGDAKKIGAAVQGALLALGDLPSHRTLSALPILARYLPDADGKTAHGVITVQFTTQPL